MKKGEKAKMTGQQMQQQKAMQQRPQQPPQQQIRVSPNDLAMSINKNAMMLAEKLMESFSIIEQLKALNTKQEQEIEKLNEKLNKKKI